VGGPDQELNSDSTRDFSFSKDVVAKTALLVAEVDLPFLVPNFTRENMAKVETASPNTRRALIGAAMLLDRFANASGTPTADSVVNALANYAARLDVGGWLSERP